MTECKSCEKTFNYDIQSVTCPHEVIKELCEQNGIEIISIPTKRLSRNVKQ